MQRTDEIEAAHAHGVQIGKWAGYGAHVTMYADPNRDAPTRAEMTQILEELVWSGGDKWLERCAETGEPVGADIPFAREAAGRYRTIAFPGLVIEVLRPRL